MIMGYVYLLLQIDFDGNESYKIGITKNDPKKRVKQLQTGNPNKISLHRKYDSKNYLKVERWLHRKYQGCLHKQYPQGYLQLPLQ